MSASAVTRSRGAQPRRTGGGWAWLSGAAACPRGSRRRALHPVGHHDEVPVLAVRRRRGPPAGLDDGVRCCSGTGSGVYCRTLRRAWIASHVSIESSSWFHAASSPITRKGFGGLRGDQVGDHHSEASVCPRESSTSRQRRATYRPRARAGRNPTTVKVRRPWHGCRAQDSAVGSDLPLPVCCHPRHRERALSAADECARSCFPFCRSQSSNASPVFCPSFSHSRHGRRHECVRGTEFSLEPALVRRLILTPGR